MVRSNQPQPYLSKSTGRESTSNEYTSNNPSQQSIETFEDLDVWKHCVEIRKDIFDLVEKFPPEEKFRLSDQMIRASRSVTANIAEGFGRFHYQESIQFCRQARGSLYELIDHLHVANERNWVSDESLTKQRQKILRGVKILNGFIRHMSQSKHRNRIDE